MAYCLLSHSPVPPFTKKTPFYCYRNSQCKTETVDRLSYIYTDFMISIPLTRRLCSHIRP